MRRRIPILLVAAAVLYGGSACSGDDSVEGAVRPLTRELIEEEAGIHFPESMHSFRLTSLQDGRQVDVSFQMDADDLDEFTTRSGITLTDGERVIPHSSPVWGTPDYGGVRVRGGTSTHGGVLRAVEVVDNAEVIAAATAATTTTSPGSSGVNDKPAEPAVDSLDPDDVTVRMSLTPADGTADTD